MIPRLYRRTIFVHSKDHADIVEEDPLPTKLIRKSESAEESTDTEEDFDESDDIPRRTRNRRN